jgi:hypothetical protein
MSFPSLGLSYYRLRVSEIAPVSTSVAGDEAGREDQAAATVAVHTMALNQFGATVGQSISEHFVIATTAKLMRAASAAGAVAGAEDPLTVLDELDPPADTFGDLDIGAMAQYGVLRVGLSVKHVFAPEFGDGANRRQLERQARAGVAVLTSPQGVLSAFTVAFDADLTKTETVAGDVRHMAIGVEAWLAQKWLGVRTGLSRSTTGPSRTTGSVGASVGGIYGLYGNASVLFGGDPSRTGWSASVSLTF